MDTFKLLFDNQTPTDENELGTITGSIVGLDSPGGEVSLDIDFGDLSAPGSTATFSLRDDGTGADKTAGDGIIEFAIQNQYLDDDPSVTTSDTYQISAEATEQVLAGTDAVFVVDVSGSSGGNSGIDVDGDGFNDSVLDAEIAAFKALNQDLIDRGLGNTSKVSISVYSSGGDLLDLDPNKAGVQTFTTPNADSDGNGVKDVVQALEALRPISSTNFEAGLIQAITAVENAGTPDGGGSVIFLSDGGNNSGSSPTDEANRLRNEFGQNVRAFGVGPASSLSSLQDVDPNAERFEDIQDLLDLFSGVGSNVNTDSANTTIKVQNVAPEIDLDSPSAIEAGSTLTLTGSFSDPGTLDTFTLSVDWGDASTADFDLPEISALRVGRNFNSTSDSSKLTITSIDTATGEVGFSIEHLYADAGTANIEVAVGDDDSGLTTETTTARINPDTGAPNGAPNAVADTATTNENNDINITANTLLANDSDPDGDALTVTAINDNQTKGTVSFDGTKVSYSPNGQFDSLNNGESAIDRFTYTISDGSKTDTATVTVTVNGVGTPDGGGSSNRAPNAVNDTATTDENQSISIAGTELLANDSDPDGDALTITAVNDGRTKGKVSFDGTNIEYDPDGQFDNLADGESATDRFTYTISDGSKTDTATVLLTINGVGEVTPPGGNPGGGQGLHLRGTPQPDRLVGGPGNDKIFGIGADDRINGKGGDDKLAGGHGDDTVLGGSGDDLLFGYNGKDLLKGGSGNDKLYGGKKNDRLEGQGGDDNLLGGTGNDLLFGGGGKDRLIAGNGRDRLDGGGGNDKLTGGNGRDTFVLSRGAGSDIITDFHTKLDVIELAGELKFGSLSFEGNKIIDDSTSKVLATLVGVDTTTLSADQFVTA